MCKAISKEKYSQLKLLESASAYYLYSLSTQTVLLSWLLAKQATGYTAANVGDAAAYIHSLYSCSVHNLLFEPGTLRIGLKKYIDN